MHAGGSHANIDRDFGNHGKMAETGIVLKKGRKGVEMFAEISLEGDVQKILFVVSQISVANKTHLVIDYRGGDHQYNRDRELQNDQSVSEQAVAGAAGKRGFQHFYRAEGGEEKCR